MSVATEALQAIYRALVTLTIGLLAYLGAWVAVDVRDYIDLRAVSVEPANAGESIPITVSRDILSDFDGGYNVTIRTQPSNHVYCTSGDVALHYRTETDPITGKDLAWWAFGGDCTDRMTPGLPAGTYTLETCHYVSRPLVILPRKTRCVGPEVFRIFGEGEPLPAPIQRAIEQQIQRVTE